MATCADPRHRLVVGVGVLVDHVGVNLIGIPCAACYLPHRYLSKDSIPRGPEPYRKAKGRHNSLVLRDEIVHIAARLEARI
jgi:hypothetical protein